MVCPELLSKLGIDLPFSCYFQNFTRRERGKGSDHGHGLALLERKFADGVACVRAVEYYSLYRAFKIIHFFLGGCFGLSGLAMTILYLLRNDNFYFITDFGL